MSRTTVTLTPFGQRAPSAGSQTTRGVTFQDQASTSANNADGKSGALTARPTSSGYAHPSASLFGSTSNAGEYDFHSDSTSLDANSLPPVNPPYSLKLPTSSAESNLFSSSSTALSSLTPHSPSPPATHNRFFYKLVAKVGDRYFSIFDGQTEYVIGQTIRTQIKPAPPGTARGWTPRRLVDQNRGGIFVCPTAEAALEARVPDTSALFCAPRVLLKVIAWGDQLQYGANTIAFSHVRPVQVFPLSLGYVNTFFGPRQATVVKLNETRKRLPPFHGPKKKLLQTYWWGERDTEEGNWMCVVGDGF